MDLSYIRGWLTDPNERFVFIEEGKPAYVILGFEAYQNLKGSQAAHNPAVLPRTRTEDELSLANARLELERIKTQELAVKLSMDGAAAEKPGRPVPRESSEIRLEDLPL